MQGRIVYARMRQLIHVDVFGQANPAPYKAFWQNEDIRTTFLKNIYSSAVAVYIHQQLQYIFISSCSIYSSAVAVYIHFSGVLSCMFCSACCAFGAMRFWPPLMMQTNWGSSRSWSLSISSWYSLGIIQRRRHFTCERSALRFSFRNCWAATICLR